MYKRFGLFLAFVAAPGLYLAMANYADTIEAACNRVEGIARDADKMKYVKEWAAARTADKEFVDAAIKYQWFEQAFPLTQRYIDLDWRSLGFYPQSAWVAFNIDNTATINSISLNQGRHGVIVKLDASSDLVIKLGPPGNLSTIRPVSDDVFVYCDP